MSFSIEGKTAIVTGGANGVGCAIGTPHAACTCESAELVKMPLVVVRPSCKQWWEAQHAGSGLHRLCGAVELHFPSQTPGALLVQTLSVATRLGWQGPVQITQVQSTVRQKVLDVLAEWGGELIEPEYTQGISTTDIIQRCKK